MQSVNPRVRDSVLVFERQGKLQFVCTMDLRVKEFDAPSFVFRMIPMLDGSKTEEELLRSLQETEVVTPEVFSEVLTILREELLLDRAVPDMGAEDRYSRQRLLFEEFIASFPELPAAASDLQARLSSARVVIVGVGGAGSWVLQSLVAAGVGQIDIVDPDVVALTNLNRQVLFEEHEVGRSKVDLASTRLKTSNPSVDVRPHRLKVESVETLEPLLRDADLVINCADEPSVAVMSDVVAEAARGAEIAHIVGGGYGGNLGIPGTSVVPEVTICWACVRAATEDDHGRSETTTLKGRTRAGGSLAPIAGMIGNIVAWETLKILLGLPLALSNQVRELDLMTLDWRIREILPQPHCPNCGQFSERPDEG